MRHFLSNYFDHLLWPPYIIGQAIIFLPCVSSLWSPYGIGQTIIFCPVVSSSFIFLSSFFPRLISTSQIGCLPYFHTWCGLSANLRCRPETCCTRLTGNTGSKRRQKSPSRHHRTILSGYIFATKARIDNRFKHNYVLHQMSRQYGELRPTSGWDRFTTLGTPVNFNGFRVLAALLHGSQVAGVSQTLRRWTDGATYVRQGDHHVGHWPTFYSSIFFLSFFLA